MNKLTCAGQDRTACHVSRFEDHTQLMERVYGFFVINTFFLVPIIGPTHWLAPTHSFEKSFRRVTMTNETVVSLFFRRWVVSFFLPHGKSLLVARGAAVTVT